MFNIALRLYKQTDGDVVVESRLRLRLSLTRYLMLMEKKSKNNHFIFTSLCASDDLRRNLLEHVKGDRLRN